MRLKFILAALSIFILFSIHGLAKTYKVLAIRVEFQKDNSELTTGDGTFDLRTNDSLRAYAIDPPPHNRWYFEDHLTFLRNYYLAVSNNQIEIEFQCFPLEPDSAYRLDNPMGYYNPYTTIDEVNQRLIELVRDAFNKALTDPQIDLSDYDVFIIFHAGVGQDIELGLDETPQDIPSLYITKDFIRKYTQQDFIELSDGTRISGAAILPETESQAGFELALNGMVVSQFASFLGLPDLINNQDKKTAVGIFDLMDVGLFNLSGLIPSIPMAWHRIQMGWADPVTVNPAGTRYHKVYPYNHADSSVYKFPLLTGEYFLVEMRKGEGVKIDSLLNREFEESQKNLNYRNILEKYFSDQVTFSERGVLINCQNFDLGIPGKGLLIWHIDENRIAAQLSAGKFINDDSDHRGIDLEEADGSQDIGESFGFLSAGSGSENGYLLDMWYDGNNAPMYKKNQGSFSPLSIPSSNSYYANAYTGLTLSDFSSPGDVMTFSSRSDLFDAGYPINTGLNAPIGLKAFNPGDSNIVVTWDNTKWQLWVAETGERLTEQSIPGNDSLITVLRDPMDEKILWMVTEGGLSRIDLNSTSLNPVSFYRTSLNEKIRQVRVVEGKGVILQLTDSVYFYSADQNGIRLLSKYYSPEPVQDVSFLSGGQGDRIVIYSGASLILSDLNLQNEESIAIPENISPVNSRILIFNRSNKSQILLFDSVYVYSLEWPSGQWEQWYSSGTGIKDIATVLWKENNRMKSVIGIVDHNLNLLEPNGVLIDYFPVMEDRYKFKTKFSKIIGSYRDEQGNPVIAVYAHGVAGDEPPVSQGIISFFSVKGKPLYQYFLPIGRSENLFTALHGVTGENASFIMFTDNSNMGKVSVTLFPENNVNYISYFAGQLFNANFVDELIVNEIPLPAERGIMPSDLVYNWPNPVKNDLTHIRFWLEQDAEVEAIVYDESGKKLLHKKLHGQGGMNNEIDVDCSSFSPGVYFAVIKAKSDDGKSEEKTIKIAVLK